MSGSKLRWGFVLGTVFLFWFLYSTVHDIKAEQLLLEYQVTKIQEILEVHTGKLEILVGSHYELHSKIDQIMKGNQ
tara:strand:- start:2518 stop:2745 length:228 start_codon:yes stop_codon:yes gene_type:complete